MSAEPVRVISRADPTHAHSDTASVRVTSGLETRALWPIEDGS